MTARSPSFFQSTESNLTQTRANLKKLLDQHFEAQHTPTEEIRSMYIELAIENQSSQEGTQHLFKPLTSHQSPVGLNNQMHNELIDAIARSLTLEPFPHQALNALLVGTVEQPQDTTTFKP